MGNCQAAEAAAAVIEHPEGKIQRLYWPTTAEEVMKCNPGHHVALVITHCVVQENQDSGGTRGGAGLRCTQVRLLKPKHILQIGQVYRLIAEQEAIKALKARKHEMLKRRQSELIKKQQETKNIGRTHDTSKARYQEINQETQRQKGTAGSVARTRQWHPALRSIAEDGFRAE